jgi:hypothetical protein
VRSVATAHCPCWLARYVKSSVSDEQLVHVLSSADVARWLMLIAKWDKWRSPVSALIVILSAGVFVYARPWQSLNLQFQTVDTAELSPCNLWAVFWLFHVYSSSAAKWVVHHSGLFPIHGCHSFHPLPPDQCFLLVRLYSYTNLGMLNLFSYPDWDFSVLFFLRCKVNARVKPAKMGHGPQSY